MGRIENYRKSKKQLIKELEDLGLEINSLKHQASKEVMTGSEVIHLRAVEEAFLEMENRYHNFMEQSRDVIFFLSPDGLLVSLNTAFERITGWSVKEWVGKPFIDLLHPEDIELASKRIFNLIKGVKSQAVELRIRGKNGAWLHAEILASAQKKGKKSIGFLGIARDITDRKLADDALYETEKKARAIFDLSFEFIGLLTPEGNVLNVNRTALEFVGTELSKVIGRPFWETPWWTHSPKVQNQCRESIKIAAKGELVHDETTHIARDGTLHDIDFTMKPVLNDLGQVTFLIPEGRDITESKQAIYALRESEERFRTLSSIATEGLMIHKDGIILDVNQAFVQILGYSSPEDLIGKNGMEIVPFTPESKRVVLDHLRNNSSETYDIELVNLNGITIPAETRGREIVYKGANARLVYMRDISERKKAEVELLHQFRLQELLMNISTTFINMPLQDVESAIKVSLGEMAEFVGADRAYIFNYNFLRQVASVIHEWYIEGLEPVFTLFQALPLASLPDWDVRAHLLGEPTYLQDTQSLPPGELRNMFERGGEKSVFAVPLMNSDECLGFVGFSWIKQHHVFTGTEQDLLVVFANMLVNIQLRKQVDEALISAKEKAEESDRLKTAFMNNISHEVRTPLNGILGFAQFVLQPGISEEEKDYYLEVLNSSSERLLNTITDYMDISLIVSGNMKINKQPLILSQLLNEIYDKFHLKCKAKNLEFIIQVPSNNKGNSINCDASLLEKSISHLIDNAIKFTQSGSIILGFSLKDNEFELFVKDTGSGINPEVQEKIFNYFIQGDATTTRGYEGSGLGLSITKELIELIGGKIMVESVKGKGSTFFISFPEEIGIIGSDDFSSTKKTHTESKITPIILIVDDDEISFSLHETILERASFKYLIARNGLEAVEICRDNPEISIVLMDIKMPVMDGLEATQKIKEFRKDLPIIGVSAYGMTGDKEKAIAAGCDNYLTKPVQSDLLLSVINKYL
jgi:PAS domain S-box-containing protein